MKCDKCRKQAEGFLPSKSGKTKGYLCENHVIKYLVENKVDFIPRIEK